MTRFHQVSGGGTSWLSAMIDMRAHPEADHQFMFADTLYEDADAYRFLIEGVAYLCGVDVDVPPAETFPDYRMAGDFDIRDYHGNPEWRAFLADLRATATARLPRLIWLVEGRDPWEVFRDKRFLGNSRVDPCSLELKREVLDAWRDEHADREHDVFGVGIASHEAQRFEGGPKGKGLRIRMAEKGWTFVAPLIGTIEGEIGPLGYMADAGLRRPRLYSWATHNNCGGYCIKAGHDHYRARMRNQPERIAYDAMMEAKLAAFLGKPVAMMTDRRGGEKRPYSLVQFLADWADTDRREPNMLSDAVEGDSGCGCFLGDGE